MREAPPNPEYHEDKTPRRRRFRPIRFLKRLLVIVLCFALAYAGIRFGPNLYRRFFGDGRTTWVSERFSEELKEKNELVVYEAALTGQDTVTQDAWLLGTVQKVTVPYSFSIRFTVDLSLARVSVDTATDALVVVLPPPQAKYGKLTVDEAGLQKYDWLYPLTPERYAEITGEIERKLTAECSSNREYIAAAGNAAKKDMEDLFGSIAAQSKDGVTCTVQVVQDDSLASDETESVPEAPTATPEAA